MDTAEVNRVWDEEAARRFLPEHTRGGLRRYLESGHSPGSFLLAVLCNDLRGAVNYADSVNRSRLADVIVYLSNYVPPYCWGSEENVKNWLDFHYLRRMTEQKKAEADSR